MAILVTTNTLGYGGAEHFSIQLYDKLKKEGEKVLYLSFFNKKSLCKKFSIEEAEIFHLIDKEAGSITSILLRIFKLLSFINRNKIEIVYCSQPQSALPFWLLKMVKPALKIVYISMHVYEVADKKERQLWKSKIPQRNTDYFLALSDFYQNDLISNNKIAQNQCFVNRLPVDTNIFQPSTAQLPKENIIIGMCARLEKVKRLDRFIKIVQAAHQLNNNVRGVIYGDGKEKAFLKSLINDSNIIKIFDPIPNIQERVKEFDILLQTTKGPNLGLTTLEALSSGVPCVIITDDEEEDFMANDTLLNQDVGLVLRYEPIENAKEIIDFIARKDFSQVRQNTRQFAIDNYSWESFISTLKNKKLILNCYTQQ